MVQAAPATGAHTNAVTLETATGVQAALDVDGVAQGAVVDTAQGRGVTEIKDSTDVESTHSSSARLYQGGGI